MIDVERTIISQYANSPTLVQLVRNMNKYVDPRADVDAFFDHVWNINTAQGFGLDIWGRIVGVRRELSLIPPLDFFGFEEGLGAPFDQKPFFDRLGVNLTYELSDDAYRQLILVKALSNIAATSARSLNQILQNLFAGRGRCYVLDLGDMTLQYTFEFQLTQYEYAIVTQSGALPRPAGVGAILFTSEMPTFGFSEAGPLAAPFGQATFITQGAVNAII